MESDQVMFCGIEHWRFAFGKGQPAQSSDQIVSQERFDKSVSGSDV